MWADRDEGTGKGRGEEGKDGEGGENIILWMIDTDGWAGVERGGVKRTWGYNVKDRQDDKHKEKAGKDEKKTEKGEIGRHTEGNQRNGGNRKGLKKDGKRDVREERRQGRET